MEPHDLANANPDSLSRLLELDPNDEPPWTADDLHAILRHQLDTEIEFDLTHFGGIARETVTAIAPPQEGQRPGTFGQVLTGPNPPLQLLDLIRRFAKRYRKHGTDGMPEEVATVLYYAAIAAARLRHGASISKLDDRAIRAGIQWALDQPWFAGPLRDLFADTLQTIRSREPETDA